MTIDDALPELALQVIRRLEINGYEAYAVGGCVRDMLCGRTPHDWDFCTNAMPRQIQECFPDCTTLTIGEKHGTITVIWHGKPYEITTYRTDGSYTDCRRPDAVTFVRSLEEDLHRRDFTVNAMAYHPKRGLVDICGGARDLQNHVLRCVGEPKQRFSEDALRIVRGLRFATCYHLRPERETAMAAVELTPLLQHIAAERILAEFQKLLVADGNAVAAILRQFPQIWNVIFPEFRPMQVCEQNHPRHCHTVWEHTLHVLAATPCDLILRWAALLHDIGKPSVKTTDANGVDHFYAHPAVSVSIAKRIFQRLHAEHTVSHAVCMLVKYHDTPIDAERKSVRRILAALGEEQAHRLFQLKKADRLGQAAGSWETDRKKWEKSVQYLEQLIAEDACLQRKDLAVNGDDLLAIGIPRGKQMGRILEQLLNAVLDESAPNEKAALLRLAKNWNTGE